MSVRFRGRKTFRLGPLFAHVTHNSLRTAAGKLRAGRPLREVVRAAFTSWGVKHGRSTHNVTRGTTSYDTPGFGSLSKRWGR